MDSTVLIRQAEVAGSIVDVFCDRSIVAMAPELPMRQADIVLEADGAALLPGLHDHHLHFFAAAYKLPVASRRSVIDDVLSLTEMTHKANAPVDGLSRGMKQRLALARVLLHDPDLLLLDEPASGLDPRARIEVRELLKALQDMGKTILISSHILHELSQLCTRIGIIETGQLVAQGSLKDIFGQLNLRRVIHIRVESPTDELLERIGRIPGVDSVEPGPDRWGIRLREGELSIADFHEALVKAQARLVMFQPEAMDMETAFMKLTEGKTA